MKDDKNFLSTKDLSYIEDMLNWNYTLINKINFYICKCNDSSLKSFLIKKRNDLLNNYKLILKELCNE